MIRWFKKGDPKPDPMTEKDEAIKQVSRMRDRARDELREINDELRDLLLVETVRRTAARADEDGR